MSVGRVALVCACCKPVIFAIVTLNRLFQFSSPYLPIARCQSFCSCPETFSAHLSVVQHRSIVPTFVRAFSATIRFCCHSTCSIDFSVRFIISSTLQMLGHPHHRIPCSSFSLNTSLIHVLTTASASASRVNRTSTETFLKSVLQFAATVTTCTCSSFE